MTGAVRTSLQPVPFRPTWEVACAIGIHFVVLAMVGMGELWTRPPKPLFDPSQVTMIQAVALPKQTKAMPDKPTRAPDPPASPPVERAAPEPTPKPTPKASPTDMALPDAPTEPTPEATEPNQAREDLLREMKRRELLSGLTPGKVDRAQTDPDGVEDNQPTTPGIAGPTDPKLARYVAACRAAILPHWTPLPSTLAAHPEYVVIVTVSVGPGGTLGSPKLVQSSGDPSFDRSAIMAVLKTTSLPPPPSKYRESAAKGVAITLAARDIAS